MTTLNLKTMAITTYQGKTYEHAVTVAKAEPNKWVKNSIHERDWVLKIADTPGSWYMTTLEERPHPTISIDSGARWDCINFGAVLNEAVALLAEAAPDRLTVAECKAHDDALWGKVAAVRV